MLPNHIKYSGCSLLNTAGEVEAEQQLLRSFTAVAIPLISLWTFSALQTSSYTPQILFYNEFYTAHVFCLPVTFSPSCQIWHCSEVRLRSWCLIAFSLCLPWSDPKPLTGVCTAQTRCLQIASCLAMLQGKGPVTTLLGSSSSELPAFPLNCMCLHKRRGCLEASLAGIRGELDHTLICFKIFDYFCPRARNL